MTTEQFDEFVRDVAQQSMTIRICPDVCWAYCEVLLPDGVNAYVYAGSPAASETLDMLREQWGQRRDEDANPDE